MTARPERGAQVQRVSAPAAPAITHSSATAIRTRSLPTGCTANSRSSACRSRSPGKLTANGVVPRRLTPVFRDQHDLSRRRTTSADEIQAALAASQFLIVLCSPTAAKSRWTNAEIEAFKRTRPEGCVLAAIVAGRTVRERHAGPRGRRMLPAGAAVQIRPARAPDRRSARSRSPPTSARGGEGKRLAFLKLVAGMLGVGLDELVQRETTRRQRRLAWLAAASLAGMAVTSTLAVTAIQARDAAREQRREAEGLVGFMLGDLKDKLEPIGKLDALDGVGSRVLAYYSKQDASELSRRRAAPAFARAQPHGRGRLSARQYRRSAGASIARRWPARRKRSAGSRTIRSACSTMRKTSSGWARSRACRDGQPSRAAYREYKRLARPDGRDRARQS